MLDFDNVAELASGCAVLGGGGGGDPITGLRMAHEAFSSFGPVPLVQLDALPDDELVVPVGLVGAPTLALEKIPSGAEGERIVEEVERHFGQRVAALMPLEIGGQNGILPVAWASRANLPFADADGMGRAFPLITQTTMNLAGLPAGPCVLVDEHGNTVVLKALDPDWTERLLRPAVAGLGGVCALAIYPMTVAQAREATVLGSVSRALAVGAALRADVADPVAHVVELLDARELVAGKVVEVQSAIGGRWMRGHAVIEHAGASRRLLRLEFQNEHIVAVEDGELLACAPDVLSVLDAATGEAIVTERLRYGQSVRLIAFPTAACWHEPAGLALAGPRAFGYDVDPRPVRGRVADPA